MTLVILTNPTLAIDEHRPLKSNPLFWKPSQSSNYKWNWRLDQLKNVPSTNAIKADDSTKLATVWFPIKFCANAEASIAPFTEYLLHTWSNAADWRKRNFLHGTISYRDSESSTTKQLLKFKRSLSMCSVKTIIIKNFIRKSLYKKSLLMLCGAGLSDLLRCPI